MELKVKGFCTQIVLDARSRNVVKRLWETSVAGISSRQSGRFETTQVNTPLLTNPIRGWHGKLWRPAPQPEGDSPKYFTAINGRQHVD